MSYDQEASTVAKRTEICLSEIEKSQKDKPANVIILLGETGAGKSSLLEYLTGKSGHSAETANSATKKCQVEKSNINGEDYYIMDTPGFDHGAELKAFEEIVNGIRAVGNARIVGVFLVIPMQHTRVNEMDQKLIRFTLELCGNEYMTQVTVVTTFWEAPKGQQQKYNTRLSNLLVEVKRLWSAPGRINHYQHGRKYENGEDTGVFLEWEKDRYDIAAYARDMIHRRYGSSNPRDPRIVQELNPGSKLTHTAAGQFLGLTPTSTPHATSGTASSSSTAPGSENGSAEKAKQGTETRTNEKGWGDYALDLVGALFRNVKIEASIGPHGGSANAGLGYSGGPYGPSSTYMPTGTHYNGPLDNKSVVDACKKVGLDSSPENRARVGQRLGVVGTPGTAAYNDELRRKIQQRY